MTGFISRDPLDSLTNLYQRPIFIQAARTPTVRDVWPAGTEWGDGSTPSQNIYITPGSGNWTLIAASGSPLNTINLVAPVANNINLMNQAGSGAITVTAPGSGGAGTIGFGVNVDGVTITIVGNQLVATSGGQVTVDAFTGPGTNPVVPVAGGITVTGAQVAAATIGANCIRTDSLAANTYTVEIQRSAAVGGTALASNGVCHFDSAMFAVDANGFVQLAGAGLAIDSIALDNGANVIPTAAGLVTIKGLAVAAATIPIRTNNSGANSFDIEVQRAAATTGTDATGQGLASFDDTQFAVDANGFVQILTAPVTATVQTTDATPTTLLTFPLGVTAGTWGFDITIAAFASAGAAAPVGASYSIIGSVRTTGAAGTLCAFDVTSAEEAALELLEVAIDANANNMRVRVTGLALYTIEWSAKADSTFATV